MSKINSFGGLFFFTAILVFCAGCNSAPDETWHCYDEQGNAVEGALIICHYGLPQYDKRAVDYRFSDALGRVHFAINKEMPPGLRRGYACIYAPNLQSGDAGIGERWHAGAPIPDTAAYFDEYKNNIYLRSGIEDPATWHYALNIIISIYHDVKGRKSAMGGSGIEQLESMLSGFVSKERARFLGKYSDTLVPLSYIKSRRLDGFFPHLSERADLNLKFSDVMLTIP